MAERTLILVKPDGVARGLMGEVIGRIERKGLRVLALELRTLTRDLAEEHYAEHVGKPFFADLVEFITSGPLLAGVVEGPDAIVAWRTMMGATNPVDATPFFFQADAATEMSHNIVHGSDSPQSAAREIGIFFPGLSV